VVRAGHFYSIYQARLNCNKSARSYGEQHDTWPLQVKTVGKPIDVHSVHNMKGQVNDLARFSACPRLRVSLSPRQIFTAVLSAAVLSAAVLSGRCTQRRCTQRRVSVSPILRVSRPPFTVYCPKGLFTAIRTTDRDTPDT